MAHVHLTARIAIDGELTEPSPQDGAVARSNVFDALQRRPA